MTLELILICIALAWLAGLSAWLRTISQSTKDAFGNHHDFGTRLRKDHDELKMKVSIMDDFVDMHEERFLEQDDAAKALLEEMEADS